jgi:uncharacterized protein (TIGR03083 family)
MISTAPVTPSGSTTSSAPPATAVIQADAIAPVDRHEAAHLAAFELDQVLNLLEMLDGDDWTQPTECTEWNVRAMAGHLAGGCAGWARWRDFRRQTLMNPYIRKAAMPIDAINRREVEDRAHLTPRQVIDELRVVGPAAIRNRKNLPALLRRIKISAAPLPGKMSVAYLADVIYPRDQWMHRMDLCRATGKAWVINPDHDRRLLGLILLDMATVLAGRLSLVVHVTGALTASYRIGHGEPQAEIDIDLFTLNRRSSGRISADEAFSLAQVRGDQDTASDFLQHCEVLY